MLPGLRPAHTRASFSSKSRLYVEKYAPRVDDFIHLEDTGLWLLPAVIAERDQRAGEARMQAMANVQRSERMRRLADFNQTGARILGRSAVTETGCIVDGLRGKQDPYEWAKRFAEFEWGSFTLTTEEDMPHIQTCGTEGCYNTRHFDIDFGRATLKERTIEVNPSWYITQPDGTIKTVWGDDLPSVEESMRYFIEFQRQNYPFIAYEDAQLTAAGISQVKFHPVAGCWEAWSYYTKNDTTGNWQFDGYGRLYQRLTISQLDEETGEVVRKQRRGHWMAHRVTWGATGRQFVKDDVLNHLCSHRRCCNPLHIRQESMTKNTNHGVRVQRAIRELYLREPDTVGLRLSSAEMAPLHKDAQELYRKLVEEMGYEA